MSSSHNSTNKTFLPSMHFHAASHHAPFRHSPLAAADNTHSSTSKTSTKAATLTKTFVSPKAIKRAASSATIPVKTSGENRHHELASASANKKQRLLNYGVPPSTPTTTAVTEQQKQQLTSASSSSSSNPLLKLVRKLVFLDLNGYPFLTKTIECLKAVEVNLAECLSKDVDFVITNRNRDPPPSTMSSSSSCTALSRTNSSDALVATRLGSGPVTPSSTSTSNNTNSDNNSHSHADAIKKRVSPNFSRSSLINRAQAIMEKAKGSPTVASNDILATADRLGIQVMHVKEIESRIKYYMKETNSYQKDKATVAYHHHHHHHLGPLDPHKANKFDPYNDLFFAAGGSGSSKSQVKLRAPYLKFESVCKQYRPVYSEFKEWHELRLEEVTLRNTHSPFQFYFSDELVNDDDDEDAEGNDDDEEENEDDETDKSKSQNNKANSSFKSPTSAATNPSQPAPLLRATSNTTTSSKRMSPSTQRNNANNNNNAAAAVKHPGGYCECCKQKYDNLKQHLSSQQHELFDRNASNFKELDELIAKRLNFDIFIVEFNQRLQQHQQQILPSDIEETNNTTCLITSSTTTTITTNTTSSNHVSRNEEITCDINSITKKELPPPPPPPLDEPAVIEKTPGGSHVVNELDLTSKENDSTRAMKLTSSFDEWLKSDSGLFNYDESDAVASAATAAVVSIQEFTTTTTTMTTTATSTPPVAMRTRQRRSSAKIAASLNKGLATLAKLNGNDDEASKSPPISASTTSTNNSQLLDTVQENYDNGKTNHTIDEISFDPDTWIYDLNSSHIRPSNNTLNNNNNTTTNTSTSADYYGNNDDLYIILD